MYGLALIGVGVVLAARTSFYAPTSGTNVVYSGSYVPLKGVHMSEAYASTLDLRFDSLPRHHADLTSGIVLIAIGASLIALVAIRRRQASH